MQVHGAVVKAHEHKGDDEHNGQKRVEVIRNGPDKELDAVIVLHNAGDRSGPGGDGGDHADGGGGGVNEIGQLRPGDLLILADRAHDGAYGQAVKIVVHKYQHAEKESGKHRAHSGFDMLLRPAAKGGGTARPVYQGYHYPKNYQKQENTRSVCDGAYDAVIYHGVKAQNGVEIGVKQAAQDDANEEGGVYLLGYEGQNNGYDRGHQSPEGKGHAALGCEKPGAAAVSAFGPIIEPGAAAAGAGHTGRIRPLGIGGDTKKREREKEHEQQGDRLSPAIHFFLSSKKFVCKKISREQSCSRHRRAKKCPTALRHGQTRATVRRILSRGPGTSGRKTESPSAATPFTPRVSALRPGATLDNRASIT